MDTIKLLHVHYLPRELETEILYVSEEYGVAGHLCACGCGNKIITPLAPTEWSFTEHNGKPSLDPSIGNWQLPCRSHYWITRGKIVWARQWTEKQIKAGRESEDKRRKKYYKKLSQNRITKSIFWRFISWLSH
jgi:hypothetical protein